MIVFILKKIISQMLMPLPVVLELLIAGLILLWFTKKQLAAKIVISLAALLLMISGFGILSDRLLARLEHMYPPVDIQAARQTGVKWVVVLGGSHVTDPDLPLTGVLTPETQARLNEGIRILRRIPHAKLLLSGGSAFDPRSDAEVMAGLAVDLGVDPGDIVLEDESLDTDDEARLIRPMVGKDRFVLVTSAYHMPRSMALFTARGMQPIPAPTCYYSHDRNGLSPGMFFPAADNLMNCEIAAHEILGLLAIQIREELFP